MSTSTTATATAARTRTHHPATSDRDYSPADVEFQRAIETYKLRTGKKFPTWSEVLSVVVSLGYRRTPGVEPTR